MLTFVDQRKTYHWGTLNRTLLVVLPSSVDPDNILNSHIIVMNKDNDDYTKIRCMDVDLNRKIFGCATVAMLILEIVLQTHLIEINFQKTINSVCDYQEYKLEHLKQIVITIVIIFNTKTTECS